MILFIITTLLLTIISTRGLTQDKEQDQCQRTGNRKSRDILKAFPFDKATSIKIVSFKTVDNEGEWKIPKINGQVGTDYLKLRL